MLRYVVVVTAFLFSLQADFGMSSMLFANDCPAPYRMKDKAGQCIWSCAQGTRPLLKKKRCICMPGYVFAGKDRFDRLICRRDCIGPYQVLTKTGQCVWSCASGTQPNNAKGTCVCMPGLSIVGKDRFGRVMCSRNCPRPYQVLSTGGKCLWSCAKGTLPSKKLKQCVCLPDYVFAGHDPQGRLMCRLRCLGPYKIRNRKNRCIWNCGIGTIPSPRLKRCVCRKGYEPAGHRFDKLYCREKN